MGLILFVLLLLFVVPITLGIIFLFRSKKIALSLFSVPLLVVIGIFGWWLFEKNHHFVKSTDLSNERLGEVALTDELDAIFKENYGEYIENENVYYKESLEFKTIHVGSNEANEIIYVHTDAVDTETANGIQVGDSLQKVKDTYGDRYYIYREMAMPIAMNYVDRKAKVQLQFWYNDGKVSEITLKGMDNN